MLWLVCLRACIYLGSKLKPAWFSMGVAICSNKALKASEKGVLCSIVEPCTCFGVLCSRGVAGLRDRGVRQALVACATPTNVKRAVEELVGEPRVTNGRDKLGYRPVSQVKYQPFPPSPFPPPRPALPPRYALPPHRVSAVLPDEEGWPEDYDPGDIRYEDVLCMRRRRGYGARGAGGATLLS